MVRLRDSITAVWQCADLYFFFNLSLVEDRLDDTCDAQELDHALRVLFSTLACGSSREPLSNGDYATSFLRAKHVHSMLRALEQAGRKLKRFPEVLFIYLTPQRNTKKGELFDVPLRLEVSSLLETENDGIKNVNEEESSNNVAEGKKQEGTVSSTYSKGELQLWYKNDVWTVHATWFLHACLWDSKEFGR